MAKAKKKLLIKPIRKRLCFNCGGSQVMCNLCGKPIATCDCDTTDYQDCEECFGTGIAFLDIEEKDLHKDKVADWKQARKEEGLK